MVSSLEIAGIQQVSVTIHALTPNPKSYTATGRGNLQLEPEGTSSATGDTGFLKST